jgi:hypothetical protein
MGNRIVAKELHVVAYLHMISFATISGKMTSSLSEFGWHDDTT